MRGKNGAKRASALWNEGRDRHSCCSQRLCCHAHCANHSACAAKLWLAPLWIAAAFGRVVSPPMRKNRRSIASWRRVVLERGALHGGQCSGGVRCSFRFLLCGASSGGFRGGDVLHYRAGDNAVQIPQNLEDDFHIFHRQHGFPCCLFFWCVYQFP